MSCSKHRFLLIAFHAQIAQCTWAAKAAYQWGLQSFSYLSGIEGKPVKPFLIVMNNQGAPFNRSSPSVEKVSCFAMHFANAYVQSQ